MKNIELKKGDKEILKVICEQSAEGMSITDVRRSIKVMDALDTAGDLLDLEDADHQYLKVKFEVTKFVKADRSILDLFDRIVAA